MDQIPPGRPAEWVPAGVPTTAPFRETGDVLPRFNLAMFTNDQAGAVAAARYYIDARNWAGASNTASAYLAICDADSCRADAAAFAKRTKGDRHVEGGRLRVGGVEVMAPNPSANADSVIRMDVATAAGRVIDANGKTFAKQAAANVTYEVWAKWSGSMWRVNGVYLAS
ncbi:hypothetical protein M6D93_15055 [Jatrophihabitans telluris]|uniref:Uncharacterized protein n=1 Tax=Jatrophihabitans telluris TaxID=2038343 RepID=A0ABY4QXH1_9ACTN|nr:hypothetical protein [Jatrophihabitans telluris]UQX87609.1 hypothetical protein M6D93_15055 [Jatrophihabitans telluris]